MTEIEFVARLVDLAQREGFVVRAADWRTHGSGSAIGGVHHGVAIWGSFAPMRPAEVSMLLERDGAAWSLRAPLPPSAEARTIEADRAEQSGAAVWFGVGTESGSPGDPEADRLRALIARVPHAFIHPAYPDEPTGRWVPLAGAVEAGRGGRVVPVGLSVSDAVTLGVAATLGGHAREGARLFDELEVPPHPAWGRPGRVAVIGEDVTQAGRIGQLLTWGLQPHWVEPRHRPIILAASRDRIGALAGTSLRVALLVGDVPREWHREATARLASGVMVLVANEATLDDLLYREGTFGRATSVVRAAHRATRVGP